MSVRSLINTIALTLAVAIVPIVQAETLTGARFEQQGVAVTFKAERFGKDETSNQAAITIQVLDAKSGDPFRSVNPLAWGFKSNTNSPLTDAACKSRIQSFLQGGLATRPEIDLNSFRLILLNSDSSVSVINPGVSVGGSKLESLLTLPGSGADLALSKDGRFLFVTIPDQDSVALFDMTKRKLLSTVQVGVGGHPTRIAIDNGGTRAWVSLASGGIAVIDPDHADKPKLIKTGAGLHNFAFPPDSLKAYVTDSGNDQVSVIDVQTLEKTATQATGKTPVDIAYSSQRRALYVANLNDTALTVIDADSSGAVNSVGTELGATAISFEGQGRFGILLNSRTKKISVLDSLNNQIIAQSESEIGEPDQVMFSARYAYIHSLKSPKVSVYPLEEFRHGKLAPVRVETGTHDPLDSMNGMMGDAVALAPDGASAFIINPAESELFYYAEGMMVPMGSFSTYSRSAQAIAIMNQGLKERAPGKYITTAEFASGGNYDFAVLIDKPRFAHCFSVSLGAERVADVRKSHLSLSADMVLGNARLPLGSPVTIGLRLSEASGNNTPLVLHDVFAMAHGLSGTWFSKQKLKSGQDGVYSGTWKFPSEGVYQILLRIPSRGIGWVDLNHNYVRVAADGSLEKMP